MPPTKKGGPEPTGLSHSLLQQSLCHVCNDLRHVVHRFDFYELLIKKWIYREAIKN